MFKRTLPAIIATLALAGIVTVGGLAGAGSADACPPAHPSTTEPPMATTATEPGDSTLAGRCAIDAEAYFRNYSQGAMDMTTTAMPTAIPGQTRSEVMAEAVEPPPVIIDEPGVLDDNTFVDAGDSSWVATDDDRESTFALDVDTGSFDVAQTFLANGYRPEPDSIRPEEWINAFSYGDEPATGADLAVNVESSPTGDGTAIVRVGVTSRQLADDARPPANITFVIDTSGSMDIRERLGLVQSSLALLVRSLRPDDTITIVTYGDAASPVLRPTPVSEWQRIVDAIDSLRPSGSTNMEAGLLLGYQAARENFDPHALNVVVLASDGVANQGVTDPEVLTDEITQAGDEGIHLVTVGYGMGNYNDHLMEQLADLGDGFYSYVDTFDEAVDLFVGDLTPTLTVVAEEAKIQVVFDEDFVTRYRLIGYENRALDDDQFRDDSVDAGELGAGHEASALYEVELAGGAIPEDVEQQALESVDVAEVRLRWRSTETGDVVEVDEPLTIDVDGEPSASLRFATLVAHTAELLRGGSVVTERGVTLDSLLADAQDLDDQGVDGASEMVDLISTAIHAEDPVPTIEE
jgi:Ca-activated chloride channel family protein